MIEDLLAFSEAGPDTAASASIVSNLLTPRMDGILEEFYSKLRNFNVSPQLTSEVIPELKHKKRQHWLPLFNSKFREDYCSADRRIAVRHREIDHNPVWYLASYTRLKLAFAKIITNSDFGSEAKRKILRILEKYVAIDMALAMSAYDAAILP